MCSPIRIIQLITVAVIASTFYLLFAVSGWWFLLPCLVWLSLLIGLLFLLGKM